MLHVLMPLFQEMDAWYKTKFADLTNASTTHAERVRSFREEMTSCKKDVGIMCPVAVTR